MSEWEALIDFGTYEGRAECWARDEAEARKYYKKHYPHGIIISIRNLNEQ